jgi:hypothetical protein
MHRFCFLWKAQTADKVPGTLNEWTVLDGTSGFRRRWSKSDFGGTTEPLPDIFLLVIYWRHLWHTKSIHSVNKNFLMEKTVLIYRPMKQSCWSHLALSQSTCEVRITEAIWLCPKAHVRRKLLKPLGSVSKHMWGENYWSHLALSQITCEVRITEATWLCPMWGENYWKAK